MTISVCAVAFADSKSESISGNFTYDNDVHWLNVQVYQPVMFAVYSSSGAGGGFPVNLTLFGSDNTVIQQQSGNPACAAPYSTLNSDNICNDALLAEPPPTSPDYLTPGTYTVAITQAGNVANGDLTYGFVLFGDSNRNFTNSMTSCGFGTVLFCDPISLNARTSSWNIVLRFTAPAGMTPNYTIRDAGSDTAPSVSTTALQSIAFPQPADVALTTGTTTMMATASSGLTVVYTSNSSAVCTVSGDTVSLTSTGVCSITANQSGNNNFSPAPSVTVMFGVLKGSQSISFFQPVDTALSAQPLGLAASATSGLVVSFTGNSPAICTVSGSDVTLLAAGTCSITASQAGDSNYLAAIPVTRTFSITLPSVTLAVGSGSGFAGDSVEIPITVSSAGAPSLTTFQLDLGFDAGRVTFTSARMGAQLTAASKTLSTNTQPNGNIRLLAVGLNQNTIANGIVAYATFTLSPTFSSSPVTPKSCTSADGQGNIISTACTAGTIRIPFCDINGDGVANVADAQLIINEALGINPAIHDLNHDGTVNVADVQLVVNAALGLGCSAT